MPTTITDALAETLITSIRNAEEPESITNEMVAKVLQYLRDRCQAAATAAATEKDDRINAVDNLTTEIELLQQSLLTARATAIEARDKATANETVLTTLLGANASQAIENFNEVINFLDGLKDNETLLAKLSELHSTDENLSARLDATESAVSSNREDLEEQIDNVKKDVQHLQKYDFVFEHRQGAYGFHGIVNTYNELNSSTVPVNTVWFVREKKCFYLAEEMGLTNNLGHNDPDSGWHEARQGDTLYSYNGDLFIFDGDDLVYWEPWLIRDDVEDLGAEVEELKAGLEATSDDIISMAGDIVEMGEELADTYRAVDKHLSDVGIYQFDDVWPSVASVPATVSVGSVCFITALKYFVQITAGAPSTALPHNVRNSVGGVEGTRTDLLFRNGPTLYKFDGNSLVAQTGDIEAAKIALFDDMWASIGGTKLDNGLYRMGADGKELTLDEALVRYERNPFIEHWNSLFKIQTYNYYGSVKITDNGGYNEKTCLYEGNGLTDITHEQAMIIDAVPRPTVRTLPTMWYAGYNMRTNICTRSDKADYIPFFGQYRIEVIALSDNTEIPQGLCYQCFRLHTIKGVLKLTGSSFANQCGNLSNVTVYCAKAGVSYNFSGNPKLSLESVKYTVDSTTVACTLVYHPDVYAKLTGDTTNAAAAELTEEELAQWQEVLATAVSKNITIATV